MDPKHGSGVIKDIKEETHRVVIHLEGTGGYEVITTHEMVKKNGLKKGDNIRFEREGTNFGFFRGKLRHHLIH